MFFFTLQYAFQGSRVIVQHSTYCWVKGVYRFCSHDGTRQAATPCKIYVCDYKTVWIQFSLEKAALHPKDTELHWSVMRTCVSSGHIA